MNNKLGYAILLLISFLVVAIFIFSGCGHKEGPVRPTTLRSDYKTLSNSEVRSMIKKHGFFDKRWNKYYSFTNQFELKNVEDQKIIVDGATGLAWLQAGSANPMPFKKVKSWLEDLNKKGYAGYFNWRLPTLEEAVSLLEQKKVNFRYIDPLFSSEQNSVHTGDMYSDTRVWGVSYQYGGSFRVGIQEANYVRAVTKYTGK